MEKPYRGLAYHAPKRAVLPKAADLSDRVCPDEDMPDAPERAYPDGGVPTECWGIARAFANDDAFSGGTDPWRET